MTENITSDNNCVVADILGWPGLANNSKLGCKSAIQRSSKLADATAYRITNNEYTESVGLGPGFGSSVFGSASLS